MKARMESLERPRTAAQRRAAAFLLFALAAGTALHARGGGGCVLEGSLVLTPRGWTPIETLAAGDEVTSPGGSLARVEASLEVDTEEHYEIEAAGRALRLTGEHPVEVGEGRFLAASRLEAGDAILSCAGSGETPVRIEAIRKIAAPARAYNLIVAPGGVFAAQGIVVHNKGCFLPDTPVTMADGSSKPISSVRPGDMVLACSPEERAVAARVRAVYAVEADAYLEVRLERVMLRVTPEPPFYVGGGEFRTIGSLRAGDSVFAFDGTALSRQRILGLRRVDGNVKVYNLATESPNTFIASGILVHNKGGGCVARGTPIATPDGAVPVESLKAGDRVLAYSDGGSVEAKIEGCFEVEADSFYEISVGDRRLRLTAEHPVALGGGVFKAASRIGRGDRLMVAEGCATSLLPVDSVVKVDGPESAYNLVVSPMGSYSAGGIVVHNKGCFLPDTPVAMADGSSRPIASVRPGDAVVAFSPDERMTSALVQAVYTAEADSYLELSLERATLRVTEEHPFYVGDGLFKTIGSLRAGDSVYAYDGRRIAPCRILGIRRVPGKITVYNLSAESPNTFIASGVLVHNKGGGFGGGYHGGGASGSGSGSSDDDTFWIFLLIVVAIVVVACSLNERSSNDGEAPPRPASVLDELVGETVIDLRARKTGELLERIATEDPAFEAERLRRRAEEIFRLLQSCWESRDYGPIAESVTQTLRSRHEAQLEGLRRAHEIDRIEDLRLNRVEIVQVRYSPDSDLREFAALVDAWARDYYVDDRSGAYLRGDSSAERFQELYVFKLSGGVWLLSGIEQVRETKRLRAPNLYEPKRAAASKAGAQRTKRDGRTRVEGALDGLARRDPLWNPDAMAERAATVFTRVYMRREGGPELPATDLAPAMAAALAEEERERAREGIELEYRNFCLRSCRVSRFSISPEPRFTALITAHAQRRVARRGRETYLDPEPRVFAEYWTFVASGGEWRLASIGKRREGR
jgi:hypothetical protein